MRHPDQVARLLRPTSTWKDLQPRGEREHDALSFEDACHALAGASPLAFQAFQLRHSEDPPGRELVAHLLKVAERALAGSEKVTPEQLVELLLREERAPESQRTQRHRQLALGITRGQYRHRIGRPYSVVAAELEALVSDAWKVARARLDAA